MTIIITHGRKELVRRQKACIDYVNRGITYGKNPKERNLQEAVDDFQRWSRESGQFKGRDENSKGMKWITTFEAKNKRNPDRQNRESGVS